MGDVINDEVVGVGETMVVFTAQSGSTDYVASPAGAESNVAAGLAALGHRSRWVSRLGDDYLGHLVANKIEGFGVNVDVEWDDARPTGVMTKLITDAVPERRYYRSQSAARKLGVAELERIGAPRWVHITGITAAISPTASELVASIAGHELGPGTTVSFDVNLRRQLWPDLDAPATVLAQLARLADVVFVSDDEANKLWHTSDIDDLADLLLRRPEQELVVTRRAGPASLAIGDVRLSVPAPVVEVVDPTGAGDAFAAGYIAGRLRDWPDEACLGLGHRLAARVLRVTGDVVPPSDDLAQISLDEFSALQS